MDFLEGALLGPLWSDTDYEDKSHRLLGLAYIVIVYAIVLYLFKLSGIPFLFAGIGPFIWLVLTLFLMVISSFLAMRYYNWGLSRRFGVLGILFLKYCSATAFLISCFRPFYALDFAAFKDLTLDFLNNTAGDFISNAAENFRVMGLVMSSLLVAALGFLAFVAFVILVLLIPILFLQLVRTVQNVWDRILLRSKMSA